MRLRNAPPNAAAAAIEKYAAYCSKEVRMGMPRERALQLLPKPHNTNTANVCVWVDSFSERSNERRDWQWLHLTKGGFFLVSIDGKVATPICANASMNAWQALIKYAGLSEELAERVLGKQP